jgi:hypothetical protein
MLKLLERAIDAIGDRLVLLAPPNAISNSHYQNLDVDPELHRHLLGDMQRLRGQIYLQDGAIAADHLTADGLHKTPEDDRSWHLLSFSRDRGISSCVWYLEHDSDATLRRLRVRTCPLASREEWRRPFTSAVESELARARRDRLRYAEVGGWAVSPESRCTSEGLVLALAAFSLGRIAGGALGLTTATVRHASATILRRLGGSNLEVNGKPIPSYYDERYGCEMELLRFDSRRPSSRFANVIDRLAEKLAYVPVIAASELVEAIGFADTSIDPATVAAMRAA